MSKKLLNILSIALIYCGAVFGAGFASGREIFTFFSCYKTWGIVSSIFTGFLFSFFGFSICKYAKEKNITNIETYLLDLFPKPMAKFFSFIANLFLVLSFCIMITGCGTLFSEQFGLPAVFASLASLLICFCVIKNDVSGLGIFNLLATPCMFIGVVVLCFLCLNLPKVSAVYSDKVAAPIISGILYLSYNMVSAAAVLVSSSKIADTENEAAIGGMLGGVLVAIPLVFMSVVLGFHWEVASFPMPFFKLIHNNFPNFSIVCSLVLYFAMMTTAVSSGVGVLANVAPKKNTKYAVLLCVLAFLISFMPFAELVVSVYSSFGVIGVLLILGILIKILRK